MKREGHTERGSLTGADVCEQRTIQSLAELPNDPQSDAEPAEVVGGLNGALEALKDTRLIVGRNSRSAV